MRELTQFEKEELAQLQWELHKIRHEMANGMPKQEPYTREMALDKINTELFTNGDNNE